MASTEALMSKPHRWFVTKRSHLTVCAMCRMVRLSKSPPSMKRASKPCTSSWAS